MNSNRIFFLIFLITALAAGIFLIFSIDDSIRQNSRIEAREKAVIDQLKLIREAERAYLTINGQYTSDWNKLVEFVKNGQFYLIEKKETVIPLAYGADSIYVQYDTLGTVPVYDSLFAKIPGFEAERIMYVPGYKTTKFNIVADKIDKSGIMVDVIEVWNPKPVNPERDEDSEYTSKKPLRFGSQFSVTTSGNWGDDD